MEVAGNVAWATFGKTAGKAPGWSVRVSYRLLRQNRYQNTEIGEDGPPHWLLLRVSALAESMEARASNCVGLAGDEEASEASARPLAGQGRGRPAGSALAQGRLGTAGRLLSILGPHVSMVYPSDHLEVLP